MVAKPQYDEARPMTFELVRDPMYQQLHRALLRRIREGRLGAGSRFLTEREISSQFAVSRATANKALSSLVAAGILEFRKGVGTFVQERGLDYDLGTLVSFTDKARAAGKVPSTRVLRVASLAGGQIPPEVARALGPASDEGVLYMERLRLADRTPVILERRHVLARLCPGLEREDLSASLYALWTKRYQLRIAGADQSIRAVRMGRADARLLGQKSGAAGLLVTSTGRLEGGAALWYERTLYRGDAYEFRNQLGGLSGSRPLVGALLR
jgi:DNA-binding GntR family transcriptional regulator